MMGLWRDYQAYVYVLALVLATAWLAQRQQAESNIKTLPAAENSADFFSNGYTKKEMDLTGVAKSLLTADKMEHYKADGATHLQKPIMRLFNPDQPPWVIQSDSGVMAADGDHLQLNGKAYIHRDASAKTKELTINTSQLAVTLSTSYAETQEWAEIIGPPNRSAGTGMQVTFVSPIHLKLLSNVKGRYEIK